MGRSAPETQAVQGAQPSDVVGGSRGRSPRMLQGPLPVIVAVSNVGPRAVGLQQSVILSSKKLLCCVIIGQLVATVDSVILSKRSMWPLRHKLEREETRHCLENLHKTQTW